MAALPTTTALWSSGLVDSSLISWGDAMALAFWYLTMRSNHSWASEASKARPWSLNSSLPFWRRNAPKNASEPNIEATPNGTPAFDETSAATCIRSSQVQLVSSGIDTLALSKILGLAKRTAELMPAFTPTRVSLILPDSTVPSMNLEVSTPYLVRSNSACRLPYSAM